MNVMSRSILVENDDTSITYVGNWTTVQASVVDNVGNYGPPFSLILHSTTTTGSFSFSFHGFSVNVIGTINIANSSTNLVPTWQCFLDGINLGSPNIDQVPENHWPLCSPGNFPDGAHELVVNVTSNGMPFYLDYIGYTPSPSVSLENSLITFENEDHAIDYISGWSAAGVIANQTTDPEGLVNITFVGIQLSWYGLLSIEQPHNASSGEYSIDGQPYSSFQLPGLPQTSPATIYNQLFFITPTLEMGAHTLSAKYTGGPGQTPLTLDYVLVTNGSFPFTNSSPKSSGGAGENFTSNSAPPMNEISKSSSHVSSIVGGVVGAVGGGIVVCLLIILFFRLRSRKQRSRTRDDVRSVIEPFSVQPHFVSPAPLSALNQTAGSQGTSCTHPSQPVTSLCSDLVSSSNNPVSPYATDETFSGPRRRLPAPAPPTQFIPPVPKGRMRIPTITPIQHEICLPRPVLDEIVVETPPAYSEL